MAYRWNEFYQFCRNLLEATKQYTKGQIFVHRTHGTTHSINGYLQWLLNMWASGH